MVAHACKHGTWEVEAEDQKFKARLIYTVNSRSPWDTGHHASKDKQMSINKTITQEQKLSLKS